MRVGIMQPYFFPYIGYFQLLNCVDKFVIYDDVSFIKRGWINRNRILINSEPKYITVPLVKQSQNKYINETLVDQTGNWRKTMLRTLEYSYKKATQFARVYPCIEQVICTPHRTIAGLTLAGVQVIADYLDIETSIVHSSSVFQNQQLKGQDRILDICLQSGATHYVNPENGSGLYSKETFSSEDISLSFLKTSQIEYRQFSDSFFPYLSIIDVLMHNSKAEAIELLGRYTLT